MEPSGPRSDHPVLWTVTSSDSFLVSALKRRRPASFFFFPYTASFWNGVLVSVGKRRRLAFFFPPYTASFWNPLSKSLLASLWNLFSITLNPHSSLPLSKITLNPHTLKSQSLFRCYLSPSSPSQRSPDRSSLVAVAAQPKCFIYGINNFLVVCFYFSY